MSFATRLDRLIRVLPEGMGAVEYIPPDSPSRLMADFYLVQFMQAPVGKRGQVLSQRAEELLGDLAYVERTLVPYLRQHMLQKAGYAILSELRHVFDIAQLPHPTADRTTDRTKATSDPAGWGRVGGSGMGERARQYLEQLGVSSQLIEQLEQSITGAPLQPDQFELEDYLQGARAGVVCFDPTALRWESMYGGRLWQQACKAWLQLYQAGTLSEAVRTIDLLYSLQHNSGALLNKNSEYNGHWLKQLLDLKFQAKEPEVLLPYASSYMRQLVPQLVYALEQRGLRSAYGGKSNRLEREAYTTALTRIAQRLRAADYDTFYSRNSNSSVSGVIIIHAMVDKRMQKLVRIVANPAEGTIEVYNAYTGAATPYRFDVDDPHLVKKVVNQAVVIVARSQR